MNVKGTISELLHLLAWGSACPGCIKMKGFYVNVFKASHESSSTGEQKVRSFFFGDLGLSSSGKAERKGV